MSFLRVVIDMRLHITYEHELPINAFEWSPRTYKQPLHVHESLELGLCVSGKGWFHFGRKTYDVRPGDLFIVNNREEHIAQSDPMDPSVYLFVNFDASLLLEEDESLLLPFAYSPDRFQNHIPAGSAASRELAPLIRSIYDELQIRREGYLTAAKSSLLLACVAIARHLSADPSHRLRPVDTASRRKLGRALAFLERQAPDAVGLKELARHLGMTPSAAARFWKQTAGYGFHRYVTLRRVREAKKELATTDRPIADICFGCGFQSMATFYRLFKEHVGLTPQQYRQQRSVSDLFENGP